MSQEHTQYQLNLGLIDQSLKLVRTHWKKIDDELDKRKIGRKDTFTPDIRDRLLVAYEYLNKLLEQKAEPFSKDSIIEMLVLNEKVHYGNDSAVAKRVFIGNKVVFGAVLSESRFNQSMV